MGAEIRGGEPAEAWEALRRLRQETTAVDVGAAEELGGLLVPVIGKGTSGCGALLGEWDMCARPAGVGTDHPGVGRCKTHSSKRERAIGAWMMGTVVAAGLAGERDISPMEALLLCVRRAAGMCDYWRHAVASQSDAEALSPGGEAHGLYLTYERSVANLARFSKLAVDAGVAAMLVQQAQTEGAAIASVFNDALEIAGLSPDVEAGVRAALREALENYGERQLQLTGGA